MNKNSHHPLHGKLFVEPTDDIQRDDPFSGPLGFLLGGMGPPSKLDLSQQYFDAANTLVEVIKRHECEDYKLAFPVLFLYRHALELILKAVMRSESTQHRLDVLADHFAEFIKKNSGEIVPSWIISRLKEIAGVDPNSMAFRYAEDKYDGAKECTAVDGDIYVSLIHLQEAMRVIYGVLSRVAGKLSIG